MKPKPGALRIALAARPSPAPWVLASELSLGPSTIPTLPCDSAFDGFYLLQGISYAECQSPEVRLIATVTSTFAIQ